MKGLATMAATTTIGLTGQSCEVLQKPFPLPQNMHNVQPDIPENEGRAISALTAESARNCINGTFSSKDFKEQREKIGRHVKNISIKCKNEPGEKPTAEIITREGEAWSHGYVTNDGENYYIKNMGL